MEQTFHFREASAFNTATVRSLQRKNCEVKRGIQRDHENSVHDHMEQWHAAILEESPCLLRGLEHRNGDEFRASAPGTILMADFNSNSAKITPPSVHELRHRILPAIRRFLLKFEFLLDKYAVVTPKRNRIFPSILTDTDPPPSALLNPIFFTDSIQTKKTKNKKKQK